MLRDKKNLLVYYSHEGNVEAIGHHIQSMIGADVYSIELAEPYPEDRREFVQVVRHEIKEKLGHPIVKKEIDLSIYDNIFIGSANWGKTITPALKEFLRDNDFGDAQIFPYFSHGGTGLGDMHDEIIEYTGSSNVHEPLLVYQMKLTDEEVRNWIKK